MSFPREVLHNPPNELAADLYITPGFSRGTPTLQNSEEGYGLVLRSAEWYAGRVHLYAPEQGFKGHVRFAFDRYSEVTALVHNYSGLYTTLNPPH